jgi:hypothetical protein
LLDLAHAVSQIRHGDDDVVEDVVQDPVVGPSAELVLEHTEAPQRGVEIHRVSPRERVAVYRKTADGEASALDDSGPPMSGVVISVRDSIAGASYEGAAIRGA